MSISIAGSMDPQKAPKHVAVDSPCTTQLLIATWKYDAVMEVDGRHKELIQEPEFCFSPSQRIPKISTHHLGMGSNPYCKKKRCCSHQNSWAFMDLQQLWQPDGLIITVDPSPSGVHPREKKPCSLEIWMVHP